MPTPPQTLPKPCNPKVLGDGVAHATRHLSPDLVMDMATLTGAQLISTGKKHAGILANQDLSTKRNP